MMPRTSCRRIGCRPPPWIVLLVIWIALAAFSGVQTALGQAGGRTTPIGGGGRTPPGGGPVMDRTVPTKIYHAAFGDYYDGDYKAALERFRAEWRGAIKTTQSRWIDSICYETMLGECYYQMGGNADALAHYTAALELARAFPTWLSQVVFQPIRLDPGAKKPPPWQARGLQAPLGQLPYSMLLGQGNVDVSSQVKQGGMIQQPNLFPIEPQEIVRCTALAIRRRGELLGPLAAHDPLLEGLIANLQRRPGQPNHWSEAWVNLQLGLALSAAGRSAAAIPLLQKATLASGEFLHPLTATAHLELGRLAMTANDFPTAAQHFEEASYASYYFTDVNRVPDLGLMEEAFRFGALNHRLANGKGTFPPLLAAMNWAKTNHYRHLYVSLLTLAAEDQLVAGQTQAAMALLDDARTSMGSKAINAGRLAARRMFLAATALYQARKAAEGDAALAKVMFYQRNSSLWLFHILKVDEYYTSGGNPAVSAARAAVDLYQTVLRDPQSADWLTDPMESLAVLAVPHGLAYDHWFEAAIARKDYELAVEVADRARRHRFLATLPLGGRLESLRWVLEASKDALPEAAVLQRQDLLMHYPVYKDLADQAAAARRELAALPLVAADADKTKSYAQKLEQLALVGRKQELVLREMAVRREPAAIAFPPLRPTAEIQKSLPPGHALLVFYATGQNLYAFLFNKEKYANWKVAVSPQDVGLQTAALLRGMGNVSPIYELTAKDLADTRWRTAAKDLLAGLLKGSPADFAAKFDELIIVPDGPLWYLPFEALQVSVDGQLRPLIGRFRIRYAPTASLATFDIERGRRKGNTAILVGKLHAKVDDEEVETAVRGLTKTLPGCVTLKAPLPAPVPVYAAMIDRLVVLEELSPAAETDPYGWSPLPSERTKTSGPLAEWFLLPHRGPEEMILPGYYTACAGSLKKIEAARRGSRGSGGDSLGPGSEIFLSLCGMMSTGTRTVLLSRWRSGGQTTLDLVREFTQELPHTTPAHAWQRAVQVVGSAPLSMDAEPRLKKAAGDRAETEGVARASHPFFWAGLMLVDTGSPAAASK